MVVYRVEHKERRYGPFYGWCGFEDTDQAMSPPSPYGDPGLEEREEEWSKHVGYRHGFASREQYERWLGLERKALASYGYVVATYEVEDEAVWVGEWQALFLAERARKLDEVCPLQF